MKKTFVGFGFGAIQGGLFLQEAWQSENFSRLVVAEVVPSVVEAVRKNKGWYGLNIATPTGITSHVVGPIEIFNPLDEKDRNALLYAVAHADEIATALPSVKFYGTGQPGDVVDVLSAGLRMKTNDPALPDAVIYTAENNNHAAEILAEALEAHLGSEIGAARTQTLNTVIGKMSGIVTDPKQISEQALQPITPDMPRALLVEAFNRILISRISNSKFVRGITVFEEKDDLLPFEAAKLYGHNATHALLGYLLREKGAEFMSEATDQPAILERARQAFLLEAGEALCQKYAGIDALFTPVGFQAYVDDLMQRMINPHLRDQVIRVTRDTRRKLGWNDRLIGTIRLALAQNIGPKRYADGARVALRFLADEENKTTNDLLADLWPEAADAPATAETIKELIAQNELLQNT